MMAGYNLKYTSRKKSGNVFRMGLFFDFVRLITRAEGVLRAHMRRTCGEPNKIELTAAHG